MGWRIECWGVPSRCLLLQRHHRKFPGTLRHQASRESSLRLYRGGNDTVNLCAGTIKERTLIVLKSSFVEVAPTGHRKSWGQSAAAMSTVFHMFANRGDTEDLFRGAFMHSGVDPQRRYWPSPARLRRSCTNGRCAGAENTLKCLRKVPFPALKEAVNMSPGFLSYLVCRISLSPLSKVTNLIVQSMNLAWGPRGGWDVPQSPAAAVGVGGQRGQDSVRHRWRKYQSYTFPR